jgi:hypothetical protein
MSAPRYVAIANPDGMRWRAYARDLGAFWEARGVRPEVEVVPWAAVVPRDGNLDGLPAFDRPALVRVDTPGRDPAVGRLLLQAGAREAPAEAAADPAGPPGPFQRPGLLYRGFRRVLRGLHRSFVVRPHLTPLCCPLTLAELYDKNATAARLTAAGVPCPPSLQPPATPDRLLEALRTRHFRTAYVKLAVGSTATGAAVVRPLDEPPWALTSVAPPDGRRHAPRLRPVLGPELRDALAVLLREGACVQRGIPMAQIDGENFDVRVVVVHGRVAGTVFRLSAQPMTNLDLGGRRGRPEVCRPHIPTRAWLDGLDHSVAAAQLYPCAVVGVDLLFARGYLRQYVLEVNAFGDSYPGLRDARGRTVHAAEIEGTARQFGLLA